MNDEQINIAIAEACGWTLVKDDPDFHEYWEHPTDGRKIGVAANPSPFPDYINDLNAMHEAEKTLKFKQLLEMEVTVNFRFGVIPFHSTARQRAEAFLRALGKWEEVQP